MSHDPYVSLRLPEYRAFLTAMAAAFVATQIQSAVLGWQIYALTHDPLALGFVGLSEAIPFLALTLLGGWAADRVDRRTLSLVSLWVIGASGFWLLVLSWRGCVSPLPIYAAQAVAGVGRAFFRPASNALGSELVPRQHYQNATTWRSSVFHVAMVLGPALGGGLIALGRPLGGPRIAFAVAYAVVVALMALSLLMLSFIAPRPRPAIISSGHLLDELSDGVRFVFSEPLILGAMSLDLFAVLFGGANALLPVFARDVLHVGEVGFGFLRAAPAMGSVLMSLALARWGHFKNAGPVLLWGVALFGLTWIVFALSHNYLLSLSLLAIGGSLDCISVVLRGTLIQMKTPQDKMGRVSAVNSFFIGSSNELGAFESGLAARLLTLVPSVIFGGTMTLITVSLVAWRAPALRRLRGIS